MVCGLITIVLLLQVADDGPRVERLPCGLRVLILEEHALPLASVQLWVRAGSAYDPPGLPGLCHVVRTALAERAGGSALLRAAGARCESRTLRDACYFATILPPEWLAEALTIEAQRLRPLEIGELGSIVAASRAAEAVRETDGSAPRDEFGWLPAAQVDALLNAAFAEHPYRLRPGTVAEAVENTAPDRIEEFANRWFAPGNATLLIVGDVRPATTLELVRRRFADVAWRESPRRSEVDSPPPERVVIETTGGARPGVDFAWVTPPLSYFENGALDVLCQRLCNPVDGPLYRRLAEIGAVPPRWERRAWREGGLLVLSIEAPPDRQDAAVAAVEEELIRAATAVPTEVELNRARTQAARYVLERRAAFGDRVLQLGEYEVVGGDALLAELDLPRAQRLPVGVLQRAASELVDARRVTNRRRPDTDRSVCGPSSGRSVRPPWRTRTTSAPVSPTTAEPPPIPVDRPAGAPGLSTAMVDQRIAIRAVRVPGLELASVRTILPDAAPWVALLPHVGSATLDRQQLADYASYRGITLGGASDGFRAALTGIGPADFVPQILELQAGLLLDPGLTPEAVATARASLRAERGGASAVDMHGRPNADAARADALADCVAALMDAPPGSDTIRRELDTILNGLPVASGVDPRPVIAIEIVSPFSADEVAPYIRSAWQRWLERPAAAAALPAEPRPAAPTRPADEADRRPHVFWVPGGDLVELRWVRFFRVGADDRSSDHDACVGWSVRRGPLSATVAATCVPSDQVDLALAQQAAAPDAPATSSPAVPAPASAVLSPSEVAYLTRLDSVFTIADALSRDAASPWAVAERCRRPVGAGVPFYGAVAPSPLPDVIIVVGGDELRGVLEKYGAVTRIDAP